MKKFLVTSCMALISLSTFTLAWAAQEPMHFEFSMEGHPPGYGYYYVTLNQTFGVMVPSTTGVMVDVPFTMHDMIMTYTGPPRCNYIPLHLENTSCKGATFGRNQTMLVSAHFRVDAGDPCSITVDYLRCDVTNKSK